MYLISTFQKEVYGQFRRAIHHSWEKKIFSKMDAIRSPISHYLFTMRWLKYFPSRGGGFMFHPLESGVLMTLV